MASAPKTKFDPGEIIFREEDPGDVAYLIERGQVRLLTGREHPRILAELPSGSLLGEFAVLDNRPRGATAQAVTHTELSVITREAFTERIAAADPIVRLLLSVLMERFQQTIDYLANPSNGDTAPRRDVARRQSAADGIHKVRLEGDLRLAMDSDQLECVFQPIQRLSDGNVVGFETLARWRHPQRGLLQPADFISLAEETRLIIPIGLRIFESACLRLQELDAVLGDALFCSVNVSARQLEEGEFLRHAIAIVERLGIDPTRIELEITETQVIDYAAVADWVLLCHDVGFQVALDDFGTGYSGFKHLLELEFDAIKIDRSFIRGVATHPRSRMMVEAIVDIARTMDLTIIAEGVEDEAQYSALRSLGVDFAQGFVIGHPLSASEILREHHDGRFGQVPRGATPSLF